MHKRTGRTAAFGSVLAAGLLCLGATATQAQCPTPRPAPAGPGLWIPDQTGGSSISVTLAAGSAQIAGTQSDITWDTAPIAAKANGKPDCTVNPNLKTPSGADTEKGATSFAFRPNGCSPTGTPCTAVRALVLSTGNVDPMADGSVLFTCNVTPPASGTATFTFSGVTLSDPNGLKVTDAGDQSGEICVGGGTPTPVTTGEPTVGVTCPTPRPAPAGPGLWIPDQTGGSSISVTLAAGSAQIAGTQSDITWDTAPIAAKANGKPDCTVNPNLKTPSGADTEKGATSFAFRPNGCSPTGTPCTAVRALVLSTGNVDPMADGSVLFTCNVTPPASGTATFTFSGVTLSDPNGLKVTDAGDQSGEICVGGGTPTPTPTGGVTCPTPRPAPAGPGLWIPDQTGGSSISVTLAAGSAQIAGTQSDITWDTAPIAAKANGKPDCTVNPNLKTPSGADTEKGATSFAFRPNGCSPTGTPCTAVRALVLSTGNVDPMADGSVLFTCNVTPPASGTATFTFSGVTLSDPNGLKVTDAGDQSGEICVGGGTPTPTGTPPTATPTGTLPTATPTGTRPTATPTGTLPTATQTGTPPTRTPTATATNTFIPTTGAGTPTPGLPSTLEDEGGCQIGAASHSSSGWLLLIPTVGLLVLRRRRR